VSYNHRGTKLKIQLQKCISIPIIVSVHLYKK